MKNRNKWMGVGLMALALTALFMGTAGASVVTEDFEWVSLHASPDTNYHCCPN